MKISEEWMNRQIDIVMHFRAMELNRMASDFVARTGLHPSQCVFVKFKGKTFPQWKGAVAVLPLATIE